MHWAGSLFLCVCGILLFIWFMPLRIVFMLEYQKRWKAAVTVSALWLSHTFELPGDSRTGKESFERTSFQIEWRRMVIFILDCIKIIGRYIRLDGYQLRCRVGFSRPDITAYCCGLFWSILAAVPKEWLEKGNVSYLPDFQQNRKELYADGIIHCRTGQIIAMMMAMFRLTVMAMLEQNRSAGNRKEIAYES